MGDQLLADVEDSWFPHMDDVRFGACYWTMEQKVNRLLQETRVGGIVKRIIVAMALVIQHPLL